MKRTAESATEVDYKAADDVISKIGQPRRPIEEVRRDFAERCHELGESHFRLIWGLRPPVSFREEMIVARISEQLTSDEFARALRQCSDRYVTEEILDLLFDELQNRVETYCNLLRLCSDTVLEAQYPIYEGEITTKIDDFCTELSRKSRFYKEEREFLGAYVAEARIDQCAPAAQLKSELAPSYSVMVLIVVGKLTQLWKEWRETTYHSSIVAFCKACVDALPRPQDLSAMLMQEHAYARIYLRQRTASAQAQTIAAQQVTFAVQANAVAIGVDSNKTKNIESPAESKPKLKLDRWSQLAVGIDGNWNYFAVSPAPSFGEPFLKSQAVELSLPGSRWKKLLGLLANSTAGQSVSCADLIRALGLLPGPSDVNKDGRARPGELSAATRAELKAGATTAVKKLNDTLSDLRRELREHIDGPSGRGRTCLQSDGENVTAGFLVAYLLPDESGHLRFGDGQRSA